MKFKKATTFLLSSIAIASSVFVASSSSFAQKIADQKAAAASLANVRVTENDDHLKVYNVSTWEEFVSVSKITQPTYKNTNQQQFKVVKLENDINLKNVDFSQRENHVSVLKNTIIDGNNHSIKNRQVFGQEFDVNDDLYGSSINYAYNVQIKNLTFDNDPFVIGYAAFNQQTFNDQNVDNEGKMLDNVVFKNVDMDKNRFIMDPTNLTGYYQSEEWGGADVQNLKVAHFDKDANVMGLFINSLTVLHPSSIDEYTSLFNNVTIKNNKITNNEFQLNEDGDGLFSFAFGIGNVNASFTDRYDPNTVLQFNNVYVSGNSFTGNSFAQAKDDNDSVISGFVGNLRSANHNLFASVQVKNSIGLFNSFQDLTNNNSTFKTSIFQGGTYDVLNQDEMREIDYTLYYPGYDYDVLIKDSGFDNVALVSNHQLNKNNAIDGTIAIEGIDLENENVKRSNLYVVDEQLSIGEFMESYPDGNITDLKYYDDLSKGSKLDNLLQDLIADENLDNFLTIGYDENDKISSFQFRQETTLNLTEAFSIDEWNSINLNLDPVVGIDSFTSEHYSSSRGIIANLINTQKALESLLINANIFLNFNDGEFVAQGVKGINDDGTLNIKFDINDFIISKQRTFFKINLFKILKKQDITLEFYNPNNSVSRDGDKFLSVALEANDIVNDNAREITVLPSVNQTVTYTLLALIILMVLVLIAIAVIFIVRYRRETQIQKSSYAYANDAEYDYYDQDYDYDYDYENDQYDYDYSDDYQEYDNY